MEALSRDGSSFRRESLGVVVRDGPVFSVCKSLLLFFSLLSRELLRCLRSIGQTRNSTVSTIRFVPFFSLSLPSFLFLFSFLFFFFIFVSNTARNKSVTNEFSIVRRDYRFFSSLGSPVPFVYRAYYGITEAIIGGIYIFDNYLGDDSSRSKR